MSDESWEKLVDELYENGVRVEMGEITGKAGTENKKVLKTIIELDFSEHDKVFEDKIAKLKTLLQKQDEFLDMKNLQIDELKQRIVELESRETVDLPFDPLECANYLINATYERETNGIERAFHNLPDKVNSDRYTVDDLEQIAEHLLVYCKHNKELG